MAINKDQHFLPKHYLRQFSIEGTNQISVTRIEPYKFIPKAPIGGQCQEDYFYKEDGQLDELLKIAERDLAPVLRNISNNKRFTTQEVCALQMFCAVTQCRTKKAVEEAKVFPKRMAYEVLKSAIEKGELPPPPGGLTEDTMDFKGVAGNLFIATVIPCWLEMRTLNCKLLTPPPNHQFITSDDPVIFLNQLLADIDPNRSFAGVSRSGFQLILPISPTTIVLFYDAKVYKVGSRKSIAVQISESDIELINSLQIQAADNCVYFSDPSYESNVKMLVDKYSKYRVPIKSLLTETPIQDSSDSILHQRNYTPKLLKPWTFCRQKRHINVGGNYRRDAGWSALVGEVSTRMMENPTANVFKHMEDILGIKFSDKTY